MGRKSVKSMSRNQQKAVFAKMGDDGRTSFGKSNTDKILNDMARKDTKAWKKLAWVTPANKETTRKNFNRAGWDVKFTKRKDGNLQVFIKNNPKRGWHPTP